LTVALEIHFHKNISILMRHGRNARHNQFIPDGAGPAKILSRGARANPSSVRSACGLCRVLLEIVFANSHLGSGGLQYFVLRDYGAERKCFLE
jgi:hypothetical protein